jgi:hypothetical protein
VVSIISKKLVKMHIFGKALNKALNVSWCAVVIFAGATVVEWGINGLIETFAPKKKEVEEVPEEKKDEEL